MIRMFRNIFAPRTPQNAPEAQPGSISEAAGNDALARQRRRQGADPDTFDRGPTGTVYTNNNARVGVPDNDSNRAAIVGRNTRSS